jgi:formylglycine-generating enzyme required for sulfatase activity
MACAMIPDRTAPAEASGLSRRWRRGPAAARCAVAFVVATLAIAPAAAQPCDGVRVGLGTGGTRCIAPGSGERFRDCPDCPEMVVVPAGSFTMGSPPDEPGRAAEREDRVRVTIAKPFAVGAFAVTRGEFAAFVAATGHQPDGGCYIWTGTAWEEHAGRSWRSVNFAQNDRHPAVCVDLRDAETYLAWLSRKTGKVYRLLSDAEREYVTRAGTATPFWWGSSISTDRANYDGRTARVRSREGEWRQRTLPVDSFRPNPWGLYGVHGNVWDWTADCWSDANRGNPGDGSPRRGADCTWRVVRGGAWNYPPRDLRAAHRYWNLPVNRSTVQGLRVARTLAPALTSPAR